MQSKLEHQFNACRCVKVERTKVYIVNDTSLFPLVAAQSLDLQGIEDCRRSQNINNDDKKQAILENSTPSMGQRINK
jgi:hypothetical protein